MELPRYHDDVVPSNIAQRVWDFVYGLLRRNPRLPFRLVTEALRSSLFWEDEEFGYFPRLGTVLALPTLATVNMVRRAVKVGSSSMPRGFQRSFAQAESDQNITPVKLTQDDSTQFSGNMVDQRGSLKQVLQNGVTPFTNMRKANIVLGKSVVPKRKSPLYGLVGQQGNLNLPFAYRFHSDLSNQRASALLLFRHNKKGRDFGDKSVQSAIQVVYQLTSSDEWHFDVSDFTQSYDSQTLTVSISASDLTGSSAYVLPSAAGTYKYKNGYGDDGTTEVTDRVWTFTFPVNWTFSGANNSPWPFDYRRHSYGYEDGVNVFPRQYQYSSAGISTEFMGDAIGRYSDLDGHLNSPFQEVSPGTPKIYYAGLNRSDLEDISLQLNPMILHRQGDTVWTGNIFDGKASISSDAGVLSVKQVGTKGFTNIRSGYVMYDGKHEHSNQSLLAKLNKLDDSPLPRGDNEEYHASSQYNGPLGTSFKYDAVLKRGGCRFVCVNRGGSGCNVDVHVFKLKKKHVGTEISWDILVKPFTDAYIKRYYEIITADDFKGREPKVDDIWNNPKFPLLPGSRHINAEDQFLNRVATHSYYIPSQGRKSVNLVFPGDRYDPGNYSKVTDGVETFPAQDEFTYFCLFSTSGEKSNAMFSSSGKLGTYVVKLADVMSSSLLQSIGTEPTFSFQCMVDGVLRDPSDPGWDSRNPTRLELATSLPSGNTQYNDWVSRHLYWDYYIEESVFWSDAFIALGQYSDYYVQSLPPINIAPKETHCWSDTSQTWKGYVYDGRVIFRTVRLPLPSLDQWLDAKYDIAYSEQGPNWVPSKPKITFLRQAKDFSSGHLAEITHFFDHSDWPLYESDSQGSDTSEPFSDVDIEFASVRTNFFSFFVL